MQRRSSASSDSSADALIETTIQRSHGKEEVDKPIGLGNSPRKAAHSEPRAKEANASSRVSAARIRRPSSNVNWKPAHSRNGSAAARDTPINSSFPATVSTQKDLAKDEHETSKMTDKKQLGRRAWSRSPWATTGLVLLTTLAGVALLASILSSSVTRQLDPKGCRMSYMNPRYIHLSEFDTEHTRFASKYSLYLYREAGVYESPMVSGIPVLFVPGNAGSYKQVRPIAAEAARYFHDVLQHDPTLAGSGVRNLDFFTVDFNEDFSAFHGQTMLEQAEYLNEVIRYILSLYLDPRTSGHRDPNSPDPTSVIILGHSMGGIVARTMLIMPNYQSKSINTIVTMSAPHARSPVSFDSQLVNIYEDINSYWRHAYAQKWANNNPLWHVTLVSITGGGLDTVVPADYASVESIVPDTHGFTVFTSSIPGVWSSMDHAAILWCDQFRKVITKALYEIVDNTRASQTKPRAERMRVFKKWLLSGMENIAEKTLPQAEPDILLTYGHDSSHVLREGERLTLRQFGHSGKAIAHLMPVPPLRDSERLRFTLLTDVNMDGQNSMTFSSYLDLSGEEHGSTKLACKNAAPDMVLLPASTGSTSLPFYRDGEQSISPYSYLQYDIEDVADHEFVAFVDKAMPGLPGWAIAEFSDPKSSMTTNNISFRQLLTSGVHVELPSEQPMVTEFRIPSIRSSLFAYDLRIDKKRCDGSRELFAPMVRQFMSEPYESRFFVNAQDVKVSLHGLAPYVPPPMRPRRSNDGISFQFWTDPTCGSSMTISLTVDPLGSLGKLVMRYRTVFAAFPLLIVAMVIRKQFRVYDSTGVFVPFLDSLDMCLRQSLPLLFLSLTLLAMATGPVDSSKPGRFWPWKNGTAAIDFSQNDLLIGTSDPVFWFMIPMIGLVCVGVCTSLHYMAVLLISVCRVIYRYMTTRPAWVRYDDKRRTVSPMFAPSSPRRRLVITGVLLILVSTFIPYQFAFVVSCLVQLTTCVRALHFAREVPSPANSNFYNYVHSIFQLMLWVLPINLPTLVVWIRNLAVQWFTPFSSHHNVLSILPFILLVETLTTGKMVPRVTSRFRHLASVLLFSIAIYAAVYGVSHAYMLHYLVNLVAAWLVAVHSTSDTWALAGLSSVLDSDATELQKEGKTP
ncbi:hypothetical protein PG996_009586 [Apiospora saccharicola]|uniref:GPI inositol-deacylase n=1 Tax=Apiospora saccharicola TaxID=335842 RepID=A0ABR1UL70_9PEZI